MRGTRHFNVLVKRVTGPPTNYVLSKQLIVCYFKSKYLIRIVVFSENNLLLMQSWHLERRMKYSAQIQIAQKLLRYIFAMY